MSRTISRYTRCVYGVPNGLQATDEGLWLVLPDFELADKSLFYNELLVDLNLLNGAFWRYMPDFCPTAFLHMSYNIL